EVLAESDRMGQRGERRGPRVRWYAGADRVVEPGPDFPADGRLRRLVARRRQYPAHLALDGMHHAAPFQMREIRLAQPQPGPADPVDRTHRTAASAQQFELGVQSRISCRPWHHHGDTIPVWGYPSCQSQLY